MTDPNPDDLLTPSDIRELIEEKEREQARAAMEARKHLALEQEHLHAAFLERELLPDVKHRFSMAVRKAVERGEKELMILHFPSSWCADGGRAINNTEPEWPETLTGYAKRAHDFFEAELAPVGYRLSAQILSFPGGLPGDVGIFVKW
jgi:hypothetical protein